MALRDFEPRRGYFLFIILNIKPTLLEHQTCLQCACEGALRTANALACTTVKNKAAHFFSHDILPEQHKQQTE